ncbi:MAG: DUF3619 family protein [bacterium]
MNNKHNSFEQLIKNQLDESLKHLDAATASQLNQARQRALDHAVKQGNKKHWLLPAGSLAAAALVFVMHNNNPVVEMPVQQPDVTDLEILTSRDEVDFYADLEFYAWLEEEFQQAG